MQHQKKVMKSYVDMMLVMVALFVLAGVSRVTSDQQTTGLGSAKKQALSGYLNNAAATSSLSSSNGGGASRFKRTLMDVQKLMLEDELMAMLICEVCEKHSCVPSYCGFCYDCALASSNNKGLTIYYFIFIKVIKVTYEFYF
jgi:hypothetical protein